MIVFEYFFKEFDSRGNDEYLNTWVAEVDRLGWEGWKVLDSSRRPQRPGLWTVVLARPAQEFCDRELKSDQREDAEGPGNS